ncbi:MAG: hypothetical protein RR331_04515 [Bacteroides sp.]
MNIFFTLMRPFIWLSRFRHRCGYGVHSPFAFELITGLIYEKTPYYAYSLLAKEQKKLSPLRGRGWNSESKKMNRLLFRLVNRRQPDTIVDAGVLSASSLYLQAGRAEANYVFASDLSELFLETGAPVDFLYLHHENNPALAAAVYHICAARTSPQSLFVVRGIHASRPMRAFWKQLQADERVGVTFDLYDFGLLFFDRTKIKQHYIVNF